jgi:hypothetical protein
VPPKIRIQSTSYDFNTQRTIPGKFRWTTTLSTSVRILQSRNVGGDDPVGRKGGNMWESGKRGAYSSNTTYHPPTKLLIALKVVNTAWIRCANVDLPPPTSLGTPPRAGCIRLEQLIHDIVGKLCEEGGEEAHSTEHGPHRNDVQSLATNSVTCSRRGFPYRRQNPGHQYELESTRTMARGGLQEEGFKRRAVGRRGNMVSI